MNDMQLFLFLVIYIEYIYFYELKEDVTELELLYIIQLKNVDNHIRKQHRSIPIMKLLKSKKFDN